MRVGKVREEGSVKDRAPDLVMYFASTPGSAWQTTEKKYRLLISSLWEKYVDILYIPRLNCYLQTRVLRIQYGTHLYIR